MPLRSDNKKHNYKNWARNILGTVYGRTLFAIAIAYKSVPVELNLVLICLGGANSSNVPI